MAQYGALTDSFRELNNLLISQQQREDALALRAAEKENQHVKLMSQLEQQKFNNMMAQKQLDLAERGEVRLADKLAEDTRRWNITNTRNEIIHDQNKSRFQWDKQNHAIAVEAAARDKQEQNLRMHDLMREAELADQATAISDLDFNKMLTPEQLDNMPLMDAINEYTNDVHGFSVRPNGVATLDDEPGSVIQMKAYEQANIFEGIQAIVDQQENRASDVTDNIAMMEEQYKALGRVANEGVDNYNFSERAAAKREMNKLAPQIQLQKDYFKPENMLEYHQDKIIQLQKHASWLRGAQQEDRAEAMDNTIKHHMDIAEALTKEIAEGTGTGKVSVDGLKQHSIYKRELDSKGRPVYVGQAVFNVADQSWSYVNEEGERVESVGQLPPDQQVGKPDKTSGTEGKYAPGILSEKEMRDVRKWYEDEGMMAGINPHAVKPKIGRIRRAIDIYYEKLGRDPNVRYQVQSEVIELFERAESNYWEDVDELNYWNKKDINLYWKSLGLKRVKGKTKKQQLKDFYFQEFRDKIRRTLKDDKFLVYRPNNTTRQMLRGE